MKNKIIAGLAALAMLVGTAMPVFAGAATEKNNDAVNGDDGVSFLYEKDTTGLTGATEENVLYIPQTGSRETAAAKIPDDAKPIIDTNAFFSINTTPAPAGVSVNTTKDGQLTITNKALPGKIEVRADYNTKAVPGTIVVTDESDTLDGSTKTVADTHGILPEAASLTLVYTAKEGTDGAEVALKEPVTGWALSGTVAAPVLTYTDPTTGSSKEATITLKQNGTAANGEATIAVTAGKPVKAGFKVTTVELALTPADPLELDTNAEGNGVKPTNNAKIVTFRVTADSVIAADDHPVYALYTDADCKVPAVDIIAEVKTNDTLNSLILTSKEIIANDAKYYVTQKSDKASESIGRLLQVKPATPAADLTATTVTVKKTSFAQKSAVYTLTSAAVDNAEFVIYPAKPDGTIGETASTTVKGSVDAATKKKLTLSMEDVNAALVKGIYWVKQKTADLDESKKGLKLTVTEATSVFDGEGKKPTFVSTTGVISKTTDKMEYSIDGGNSFIACTGTTVTLTQPVIATLTAEDGIIVRVIADPLDKITITLTEQAAPIATSQKPANATATTGTITVSNVDAAKLQYKLTSSVTWLVEGISGGVITAAPGVYNVRFDGKDATLPSKIVTITILKYNETATQTGIKVADANKMAEPLNINGKTTFDATGMTVVKTFNDGTVSAQPVLITEPTEKITTSIKNDAVLTSNDKTVKITWGEFSVEHKLLLNYNEIGTQMGAVRAGSEGAVEFAVTGYRSNKKISMDNVAVVFADKDGKETVHEGIATGATKAADGKVIIKFDIAKTAKAGSYSFGVVTGDADDTKIYTAGKLTVSATGATIPPVTPSTGGSGGNNNYYYGGSGSTGTSPKVPDNTAASAGATVKADGAVISGAGVPAGAKLTVVSSLVPSAGEAFPSFVTGKANAATVSALNGFATRGALKGVFNISLDKALTSAVTVTIPTTNLIPDQSVTVIHVKDDGTSEYLVGTANKNGNLIVPGVKSLSPFIVLNAIYQPTASGSTGGTTGGTTGGDTTSTVPKTGVELLAPLF